MDAEQAINTFWSSFGLEAYDENSVPDDASLPYITYSVSFDSFDNDFTLTASLWGRSSVWTGLTSLVHAIGDDITDGGKLLPTDNGAIWLRKGSPFYQRMGDEDKSIKRIYINVYAEYIYGSN